MQPSSDVLSQISHPHSSRAARSLLHPLKSPRSSCSPGVSSNLEILCSNLQPEATLSAAYSHLISGLLLKPAEQEVPHSVSYTTPSSHSHAAQPTGPSVLLPAGPCSAHLNTFPRALPRSAGDVIKHPQSHAAAEAPLALQSDLSLHLNFAGASGTISYVL